MKTGTNLLVCALFLALAPTRATSQGDKWVSMFRADAQHTGVYNAKGPRQFSKVKWVFKGSGEIEATPVVANRIVLAASHGFLYAIDAQTGHEVRESFHDKNRYDLISSPIVDGKSIYLISLGGYLYRFDVNSGHSALGYTVENNNSFPKRFDIGAPRSSKQIVSSPVLSGDMVLVGSDDGFLYAIDSASGKERWKFRSDAAIISSPALAAGTAYIGSTDSYVYAIDVATGRQKWQFLTRGPVISSPAIIDGILYIGSVDGNLYAIDTVNEKETWRFATGNRITSSPAFYKDTVYVASTDGQLYALDRSGNKKWSKQISACMLCSPAIADGILYVGSRDVLYALDAMTGEQAWRYTAESLISSSPLIADGVVYFGTEDGRLYAIE